MTTCASNDGILVTPTAPTSVAVSRAIAPRTIIIGDSSLIAVSNDNTVTNANSMGGTNSKGLILNATGACANTAMLCNNAVRFSALGSTTIPDDVNTSRRFTRG